MIKLIATDMDGTLLDKNHEVSKENRDAIIRAQEKGVKFVLASGRPTYGMLHYIKELKMKEYGGYLISYNGGQIIDCKTMKPIFSQLITSEQVNIAFNKAKEFGASIMTYIDNMIYIYKPTEYTDLEVTGTKMDYTIIEDINEVDLSSIVKCLIVDEPEKLKIIEKNMKETLGDIFYVVRSQPVFLEVLHKDVDKGKTLERLIEILNLDKENVIAVGDNYNDYPLLEAAGIPIAVENAKDKLKKIAKYISVHHENHALRDIINKYVEE